MATTARFYARFSSLSSTVLPFLAVSSSPFPSSTDGIIPSLLFFLLLRVLIVATRFVLLAYPTPPTTSSADVSFDGRVDVTGLADRAAARVFGPDIGAPASMPQLDLDVLPAGLDLQEAARGVRATIGAAHHALFPSSAYAGAVAGARRHAAHSGIGFGLAPLAPAWWCRTGALLPDLQLGAGVAGGDAHMAARLVRPAVSAAQWSQLVAPTDVLAGTRAQRKPLHILHANLELWTLHLFASTACQNIKWNKLNK